MSREREIEIADYTYILPENRIAKYPLQERDSSKLLVFKEGKITDDIFRNLPAYIDESYQLIFNNTRVIRARLRFRKESGAMIEIFCLEPFKPSDHALSLSSTNSVEWRCLVGNLKKWKSGSLTMELQSSEKSIILSARLLLQNNGDYIVQFSWSDDNFCFSQILEMAGNIPVPPYLNRKEEEIDNTRYQTIYSKEDGSVAAPTAGLHFNDQLFEELRINRVEKLEITLHVGAGTFVPVKKRKIGEHEMHTEHFTVSRTTIRSLLNRKNIAVGTTTARTIESIYWLGVKIIRGDIISGSEISIEQWDPYDICDNIPSEMALSAIDEFMLKNGTEILTAKTSVIIVPGYTFRLLDGMITNFHMPQSTLLLLVAALTSGEWRSIYEFALNADYRFLSYGDSSLILLK